MCRCKAQKDETLRNEVCVLEISLVGTEKGFEEAAVTAFLRGYETMITFKQPSFPHRRNSRTYHLSVRHYSRLQGQGSEPKAFPPGADLTITTLQSCLPAFMLSTAYGKLFGSF